MKRRDFGLLAGTSLATAAMARPTRAQAADPSLLDTTLTPLGAERAGNADGSIPAWTGGLTAPPVGPTTPTATHIFEDEQPLYEVNAGNMAQYADLLSEGTKAQITKFGLTLKVYQSHRTAAWPQYIYDNAKKNVVNAKLDPNGGRLGFTGAYGAIPFPIIDTSDPLTAGAQLIWNHLSAWVGYSDITLFAPGMVVISGQPILDTGTYSRSLYPYYDPKGSLETFGGYYSTAHYYDKAPGAVVGEETLVWHSTNVNLHPDIVWTLLNGQGRVRKAPNMAFDAPNPEANGIGSEDEASTFYGNPSQYDWTLVEKKEMLVPYNCNKLLFVNIEDFLKPHFPDPELVRWEKHRVWVVDAHLHPGERNVNSRRRLYFDEDTSYGLLGEGYDGNGDLWKAYAMYLEVVPSLPGAIEMCTGTFQLQTGDYVMNGNNNYKQFSGAQFIGPQDPNLFLPEQMASSAAF
jgi:Protein of unknown function (DUF1329)